MAGIGSHMAVVWYCEHCELPVSLRISTTTEPYKPGAKSITVTCEGVGPAVRAHLAQHRN